MATACAQGHSINLNKFARHYVIVVEGCKRRDIVSKVNFVGGVQGPRIGLTIDFKGVRGGGEGNFCFFLKTRVRPIVHDIISKGR